MQGVVRLKKENKTVYVILGLLNHEDLTGYDIKKRIDQALSFFWEAGFGQIYPSLKLLEREGLVEKRTEKQENRPNRLIYSITARGRNELRKWLAIPVEKEHVRYEILLKIFFGGVLPVAESAKIIEEFRLRTVFNLEVLEKFKDNLSKVLGESPDHLYYLLTVLFGEKVFKAYLEWAEEAASLLKNPGGGRQS